VTPKRETFRALGLGAVAAGLLVLTATACVLSYPGVHELAVRVGLAAMPAKVYPVAIDAMLVVAAVSVLALRGAGLFSRLYSWLCLLVAVAGLTAASVAQAAGLRVPHRAGQIGAAVIPFVLVLAGFGLLIALLRYAMSRSGGGRRQTGAGVAAVAHAAAPADLGMAAEPVAADPDLAPAVAAGLDPAADPADISPAADPVDLDPAADPAGPDLAADPADPDPAVDPADKDPAADPAGTDPAADHADPAAPVMPPARPAELQLRGRVQDGVSPASTLPPVEAGEGPGKTVPLPRRVPPALRRPHSSPTPPKD